MTPIHGIVDGVERKTNRNLGPNVGPTRTGNGRRVASAVADAKKPQDKKVIDRKTWGGKFRFFGFKMALPHVLAVAICILIAMVALMSTDTSFVAFPATLGQLLLVTNGAPVASDTQVLGVIPLAPALIMMWITGHRVRKLIEKRVTTRDLAVLWILGLIIPLIITTIAIGMVWDAKAVYNVGIAPVWAIYLRVLLIFGGSMLVGCGPRLWRSLARRKKIPPIIVDGAVAALEYAKWVVAVGLVVYILALFAHIPAIVDSLDAYQGAGAKFMVCLVSLFYLPNAVLVSAGIMHGAELVFGAAHISLFGSVMVPMPPLPLVAALPSASHSFMFFLLLAGIIAPVIVAYRRRLTFLQILVATPWVALIAAWAIMVNSGTVGVYGYVGVSWLWALIMPVWWLLPSMIVHLIVRLGPTRPDELEARAAAEEAAKQARREEVRARLEARRARQEELARRPRSNTAASKKSLDENSEAEAKTSASTDSESEDSESSEENN